MNINIGLTEQELITINNSLNEICNIDHIKDWEFQTRLGVNRDEARRVPETIHNILDDLPRIGTADLGLMSRLLESGA
jgi:hypothetical protein